MEQSGHYAERPVGLGLTYILQRVRRLVHAGMHESYDSTNESPHHA